MSDDDIDTNDFEPVEESDAEEDADIEEEFGVELDEAEIDPEELDDDDPLVIVADDDDDDVVPDDDEDDEVDEPEPKARARKRKSSDEEDEEDDDDDLVSPDDVEADLDEILKDRMVTVEEEDDEDDEDVVVDDRGEAIEGIQPKRPDEILCSNCFLLVRPNAGQCPVEDDACPVFN